MINIEPIEKGFDLKEGFAVTMESQEPEFAAKLVNDYVSFFDLETINALVLAMRNSIENQIMDIEYIINSKRKMAFIRRQDQIRRYEEAAKIASSLGARERIEATNVVQNNQRQAVVEMQGTLTPLYYLGSKAIEAEIVTLKNRKSDDPFIVGLRDLEEQLSLLRSINIDKEGLNSVNIDQNAYPPNNSISPNRRKIAIFGTAIGLFSSIFLVFSISFFQKNKGTHS